MTGTSVKTLLTETQRCSSLRLCVRSLFRRTCCCGCCWSWQGCGWLTTASDRGMPCELHPTSTHCDCCWDLHRDTHTYSHTHRQTDTQTDRQTQTNTDKQTKTHSRTLSVSRHQGCANPNRDCVLNRNLSTFKRFDLNREAWQIAIC